MMKFVTTNSHGVSKRKWTEEFCQMLSTKRVFPLLEHDFGVVAKFTKLKQFENQRLVLNDLTDTLILLLCCITQFNMCQYPK